MSAKRLKGFDASRVRERTIAFNRVEKRKKGTSGGLRHKEQAEYRRCVDLNTYVIAGSCETTEGDGTSAG